MDMEYVGPYIISKALGKGIYALSEVDDTATIIHKVSGAHLKPYKQQLPDYQIESKDKVS